jgi:hypothetical protein
MPEFCSHSPAVASFENNNEFLPANKNKGFLDWVSRY